MLFLIFGIACGVLVSVVIRLSKSEVRQPATMYIANYVICEIMALTFFFAERNPDVSLGGGDVAFALTLGAATGILYPVGFRLMRKNVIISGMALTSTISRLGILAPTILAIVVFKENPTVRCCVGIAIAILAIIVMGLANKGKSTDAGGKPGYFWLLIHLMSNCVTESANKIFDELGRAEAKNIFLIAIFFSAFMFCLIWMISLRSKPCLKDIGFGIALGIPNYLTSRCILMALNSVKAVIAFPVMSVGTIISVALAGVIFFKEKLNRTQLLGMAMILVALVLLNL